MSRRAALALHGHKVNLEQVCACYCWINTHTVSALCSSRLVVLMWLRILTTVMECTSETGRLMPTIFQSQLAAHSVKITACFLHLFLSSSACLFSAHLFSLAHHAACQIRLIDHHISSEETDRGLGLHSRCLSWFGIVVQTVTL